MNWKKQIKHIEKKVVKKLGFLYCLLSTIWVRDPNRYNIPSYILILITEIKLGEVPKKQTLKIEQSAKICRTDHTLYI